MTVDDFLPLGADPRDPSGPADPVRAVLRGLRCDLVWTAEHAVSVDVHRVRNEAEDEAREFAYLTGAIDDALQTLARLIELLALGHTVDWRKLGPRGNSPPYFLSRPTVASRALCEFGAHPLDPSAVPDPLTVLLSGGKLGLVRLADYTNRYRWARQISPDEADALAHRMSDSARRATGLLTRAIELLLLGHRFMPPATGTALAALRVFKSFGTSEWAAATHPTEMCHMLRPLDYGVTARFDPRKWQRFARACLHRVRNAPEGLCAREAINAIEDEGGVRCTTATDAVYVASQARQTAADPRAELSAQAALLRELFGDPFTAAPAAAEWLDWNGGTVPALAEGIEKTGAFDRMPILGDALEDAGCTDAAILTHCRGPHGHVRGCWVLDLLLGKHLLPRT